MTGDAAPPRGLLAVFAHPDDESFGAGGTLALAATAGMPAWLVCATDGDLGGGDDAREMDPEIRRRELRCAASEMGIAEPIFLGYRDSGMEGWPKPAGCLALADRGEVVERIAAVIRRLRPAVIVTFDPGGIYGHPDHVAISVCATAAFELVAAEPGGPLVLYHQALARSSAGRLHGMFEALAAQRGLPPRQPTEDDLLQERRFVELARPDDEITTIVDVRAVLERKLAALACHVSQMGGRDWNDAPPDLLEAYLGAETFVRVAPAPARHLRESALFGLEPMP